MTWPDLVHAREQIFKFLQQIHPEDRLGIYFMGPKTILGAARVHSDLRRSSGAVGILESELAPESASAKMPDVWAEFAHRVAGVDAETATAIHRAQFWDPDASGVAALPEKGAAPASAIELSANLFARSPPAGYELKLNMGVGRCQFAIRWRRLERADRGRHGGTG